MTKKPLSSETREVVDRLAGRERIYDLEVEVNGITQRTTLTAYPRKKQQALVKFRLVERSAGWEVLDELALQLEVDVLEKERITLRNPHD